MKYEYSLFPARSRPLAARHHAGAVSIAAVLAHVDEQCLRMAEGATRRPVWRGD